MAKYASKFPSPLMYTDRPAGTTSYVTQGEVVGRYETGEGINAGSYITSPAEDWISNPVGVQKMPTPDGWTPEWPVQGPIGPSANYRSLPSGWGLSGCAACGGLSADSSLVAANMAAAVTSPVDPIDPTKSTPSSWVVPAIIAGAALLIFWGTLQQGRR